MISFWIAITFLGLICLATVILMIVLAVRQNRYLKKYRNTLKRGDVVRVRGFKGKQYVWENLHNGYVLIDMSVYPCLAPFCRGKFPKVKTTDVYPWNTPPEKWDIAKMEWR